MKNPRLIFFTVLLVSLVVALATCGGKATPTPQLTEGGETSASAPEPTRTTESTDSPPPTDSSETATVPIDESPELDPGELIVASELNSYRSAMTIQAEGIDNGEEIQGTIEFLIEYTRDPLAQHIVISSTGFDASQETPSTDMYQVEDTTYMKFGEEWFSMPAAGEDPLNDAGIITPDDMLGDTCGWKQQSDTSYNDIEVHHWRLQMADLEACVTAEQLAEMGEIADASGNLYVAVDGGYLAHMDLVFEGQDLALGVGSAEDRVEEGRIAFTFEMTDVNEPFTIQVPEEALATNDMPEDIPIPDGSENVTNIFGMIAFLSASSPQEATDFYRAEMPGYGWTQTSDDEFGGTYMLEYSKGNRTASLMISTDPDSSKTSVLIAIEGE